MAGDRNGELPDKRGSSDRDGDSGGGGGEEENGAPSKRTSGRTSEKGHGISGSEVDEGRKRNKLRRKSRDSSDSDDKKRGRSSRRKGKSRRRYSSEEDSDSEDAEFESSEYDSDSENSDAESASSSSGSEGDSESEEERRRRKRRERRRRREKEERERKRRKKEKEKKKRKKEREEEKRRKEKKKEKKERGKKGAVTNSWGKYGIIKETDMWNKRPEFTAWLAEIKKVNLESLANWEEKQMFKEFMEDHNTATFPSKKYYNLDAYYQHKMLKDMKKGHKKLSAGERTVFDDEEQRRQELLREREKHKEEQVEALKRSMQTGMAQAMKEQARLREEMAYQYKLGNFEAAAAIQRRLDPDVAL
ncbi:troponin I [Momordica charantia]|uniref:Troponin I n=1 Tax=Momordica charantia TaxID=3673 RepID=A0A6J1CMB2_MOMCH|nr:troponin I [Momordica charantia]